MKSHRSRSRLVTELESHSLSFPVLSGFSPKDGDIEFSLWGVGVDSCSGRLVPQKEDLSWGTWKEETSHGKGGAFL